MRIVPLVAGAAVLVIVLGLMVPIAQDSVEDIDGDEVYLFCLMGQSNSVNATSYGVSVPIVREEVPLVDPDKAYYFGMSSPIAMDPYPNKWEDMVPRSKIMPMIRNGEWAIGGLEAPLASKFVDDTGRTIVTVNVGRGGISITQLMEGGDIRAYADTLINATLERLADEGKTVRMGCIFWLQGERNRAMEVDTYMEDFRSVWSYFRDTYGFTDIVMAQTRAVDGGNATEAQALLAAEGAADHIYMGTTASQGFTMDNGMVQSDDIHYTQKGKDVIGNDLMTFYVDNLYEEGPKSDVRTVAESIPVIMIVVAAVGAILVMIGIIGRRD